MDSMIEGMYKNKVLSVGPIAIAKTVEKSLARRSPHARYVTPVVTRGLIATRMSMTPKVWDAMLRVVVR
jgi:hypothetical protein